MAVQRDGVGRSHDGMRTNVAKSCAFTARSSKMRAKRRKKKREKEKTAKEVGGRREEERGGSGRRGGGNGIRGCGWMEFVSEEPRKVEQQL